MKLLAANIYSFINYAEIRGILRDVSLRKLNTPALFSDPYATVPVQDFYSFINLLAGKLGHQLLGIRIGELSNLNSLGLIYQISLQANTISEALFYLKSYIETTFQLIEIKVTEESEWVKIEVTIPNEEKVANKIILEYVLTIIKKELCLMCDEGLKIFANSPYADAEYPDYWCKSNDYSIYFKPSVLKTTLQDKSRLNLDLLIPEYLKLIETLSDRSSFTSKVKFSILHMANPQLPDLEAVADCFCLSPRTLQRNLQKENTNFRSILDEQKKAIAGLLLRHGRYSVSDLSYILGYSEPASFIHSFHKWFNKSPTKMNSAPDL